eukprot:CAMPEP_0174829570 /NCGR_PEP_ID=MMETSP1114-20130205/1992_1 /TAXON_ID=312471 /ORGANISM="Neobodo designis, Strain CCAP 1951/1" /LENGTH=241 /DNA_ID=CAMNT_0016063323 /DNA_START=253 /DNA_END=978 /DNA_ORIENTATION=+
MRAAEAVPSLPGAPLPSVVVGRHPAGGAIKPALDRGAFSAPVLAAKHGIDVGRYKTQLCKTFREKGSCPYASRCMFAHGRDELRTVDDNVCLKTAVDLVAPLVPPKASGHRRRSNNHTKHSPACAGGDRPLREIPSSPFEAGDGPNGADQHNGSLSDAAKSTCGSERRMRTPAPPPPVPAADVRLMPPCLLPRGPAQSRGAVSSDDDTHTSHLGPSAWRPVGGDAIRRRYVHDPYTVPSPW